MEIGQRLRVLAYLHPVQRAAAEHVADPVRLQIARNPAPQQADGRRIAVFGRHARSSQFEQLQPCPRAAQQRPQIEFASRIEAAVPRRDALPKQAVGADDGRIGLSVIEHQQMIAHRIIRIDIEAARPRLPACASAFLLEEYAVAQRLRRRDLGVAGRKPHLECARAVGEWFGRTGHRGDIGAPGSGA